MRLARRLAVTPTLALLASCASMHCTRVLTFAEDHDAPRPFARDFVEERPSLVSARTFQETAAIHIQKSEFNEALEELEKARRLAPGDRAIRATYIEVSRILNRRPAEWSYISYEYTEQEFRIQRAQVVFEKLEREADQLMDQHDYAGAAANYRAAAAGLEACPVFDFKLNDYLHRARERTSEALRLMRRD